MLVLTRKYQEKVHIGDGITITILRTKGKAVRLGIEAPAEVPVIRGELSFHQSPANSGEANSVEKVAPSRNTPQTKVRAPQKLKSSGWRTESDDTKAKPQVTLQRVPRDKASEIMPCLLSGNAPLRDMMQRTRAV
jgi:carbon storage regulator CsrA